MTSQPNAKEPFKEYYGRTIDAMPQLAKDGRVPLSVAGLMQRRLEALAEPGEMMGGWWNRYFDTGDAILYHPSGRMKIMLDSNTIQKITPESKLWNGAMVLPDDTYDTVIGIEISRNDVKSRMPLTLYDAMQHPVWNALARDKSRLDNYLAAAVGLTKQQCYHDAELSIILSDIPDMTILRPWVIASIGSQISLFGGNDSIASNSRYIGVFPETIASYTKR